VSTDRTLIGAHGGSAVNFQFFRAQVGYRFRFTRHVAAHDVFDACIFKGENPFLSLFTLPSRFRHCHFFFFFVRTASLYLPLLRTSTSSFFLCGCE
jgi:hypothetical protein